MASLFGAGLFLFFSTTDYADYTDFTDYSLIAQIRLRVANL